MCWLYVFLFLGFYPYLLYPLLVWLAGQLWPKPVQSGDAEPSVTVVIAAYNEAGQIAKTVMNKLDQDYPAEKMNVVVISDASDDGTDEIIEALSNDCERVSLIRQTSRQGKTAALNRAIEQVDSEIIVFSDANSIYAPNAIRELNSRFADPYVGYVTGKMVYSVAAETTAAAGSSAYMRYENTLRSLETKVGSTVGVDGGIDAVRRALYKPMRPDQLPDLVLPLSVVEQGYRVVFAKEAELREDALVEVADEFKMRVRVATRALWALLDFAQLLNPKRFGLYSWQLLSHKWLRYLSFIPLSLAVLLTWSFSEDSAELAVLRAGEALFFVLAVAAWFVAIVEEKFAPARWCFYFLLLNAASVFAVANLISGERFTTWKPRQG